MEVFVGKHEMCDTQETQNFTPLYTFEESAGWHTWKVCTLQHNNEQHVWGHMTWQTIHYPPTDRAATMVESFKPWMVTPWDGWVHSWMLKIKNKKAKKAKTREACVRYLWKGVLRYDKTAFQTIFYQRHESFEGNGTRDPFKLVHWSNNSCCQKLRLPRKNWGGWHSILERHKLN